MRPPVLFLLGTFVETMMDSTTPCVQCTGAGECTFLVARAAANCSEKPPSITAECVFLNVSGDVIYLPTLTRISFDPDLKQGSLYALFRGPPSIDRF